MPLCVGERRTDWQTKHPEQPNAQAGLLPAHLLPLRRAASLQLRAVAAMHVTNQSAGIVVVVKVDQAVATQAKTPCRPHASCTRPQSRRVLRRIGMKGYRFRCRHRWMAQREFGCSTLL